MVEHEDEIEQPELSSPVAFSSESENGQESDESDGRAPIEGLIGKKIQNGKVLYEVQWSGPYVPTWEPADSVTAESIAEFENNNAAPTKRGRGRPPKNKQTATSTANAPKTRSAVKAAKKSAK